MDRRLLTHTYTAQILADRDILHQPIDFPLPASEVRRIKGAGVRQWRAIRGPLFKCNTAHSRRAAFLRSDTGLETACCRNIKLNTRINRLYPHPTPQLIVQASSMRVGSAESFSHRPPHPLTFGRLSVESDIRKLEGTLIPAPTVHYPAHPSTPACTSDPKYLDKISSPSDVV